MDYSEEQKVENPVILFVFLFIAFAAFGGSCIPVYQTMQKSGEIYPVIWGPVGIFILEVTIYLLLFTTTLEMRIGKETYRYFPFVPKNKLIPFDQILSWNIKSVKTFRSKDGFGYNKNQFVYKTSINLGGKEILELQLKKGRTLVLSTNDKYNLSIAMKKYIGEKENLKLN